MNAVGILGAVTVLAAVVGNSGVAAVIGNSEAVDVVGDGGAPPDVPRGGALFSGAEALTGSIRGHRSALPPDTVRCRNCHGPGEAKSTGPGSPPPLTRALLLEKRSRRGGPPSSYDEVSLCKLLRTGVDPAYILISRVMPIYDIDNGQCRDLWGFLIAHIGAKR